MPQTLHNPSLAPREIAAAVLLGCYGHCQIGELILAGMSPRDAGQATAEQHFQAFTHMYTAQLAVPGPGFIARMYKASRIMYFEQGRSEPFRPRDWVPDHGPHPRWTTWCLTQSLEAEIAVLDMTWPAYVREFGLAPRATISADTLASLRWMTDMLLIMATGGGDLLQAGRIAHDRALGRPRRKRKPADPHWLAGAISGTLDATWSGILDAQQWSLQDGWQPFWRHEPRPPTERPYAT